MTTKQELLTMEQFRIACVNGAYRPAIAARKRGRGLGARKRRMREARALRTTMRFAASGLEVHTFREWLLRVGAPR